MPGTTSVMLGSHWVLSPIPSMQGYTLLTMACREGMVSVMKVLLKAGADVDQEDDHVRGLEHTTNLGWRF